MKILVTGAAGFIGSHLTESLLSEGHSVVGVDNFNDYYDPEIKRANWAEVGDAELAEIDLRDAGAVQDLIQRAQPEVVMHLAAQAGVRPSLADPVYYHDVNVTGTLRLLEAIRKHPVERFVFASSSSVYGNCPNVPFREDDDSLQPISPYGASKLSGEHHVRIWSALSGIPSVALRFFTVYGPRQRPDMAIHKFIRLIESGETLTMYGAGDTRRDYTYVDDIIQGVKGAMFQPLHHPFRVYNLGESQTILLRELIETIEDAVGKPANIHQIEEQPGDVKQTFADITRARTELGYDPQVPVSEGVRRTVAWFREQVWV
jgi:UDP-glucuronate 4-epimerase